jgi:NAD(P)-dependent dehydrogenase (short-subunit alcohol dehydrogenase family)
MEELMVSESKESFLNKFCLPGKVALVTGGSRGIGRAIALGLAEAGADIVICGRKLPDLEKVADEIRRLGRKSVAVSAHIGRMEEITKLAGRAKEEFGRIDILVNNAGTGPSMPLIDLEEGLWDSIMNLNLKGLVFLSQAVAGIMKEHGGGRIINIASMDAFKPELNGGVYAISKAGVVMATKAMAREWAQYNIRVNAIAPGNIHTRLGDSRFVVDPQYKQEVIKKTPMARIAEPEDIAGAAIYLASDASSYMTGETIIVDGGFLLS